MGLQGLTEGYKGLQVEKRLQKATRGYRGLQGVTKGGKDLQKVTGA